MMSLLIDRPAPTTLEPELAPLLEMVEEATTTLAGARTVPGSVVATVRRVSAALSDLRVEDLGGADPYQVERLLHGMVTAQAALDVGDAAQQRRQLRVGLERVRQGLRDLLAEQHVSPDRPPREIARWLTDDMKLPLAEVSKIAGVSPRTFQRWTSPNSSTEPSGDDQLRLRTLARAVDQLRWSMTPVGVVRWLARPHPALGNRPPAELLGEPGAYEALRRLAGSVRSMVAT